MYINIIKNRVDKISEKLIILKNRFKYSFKKERIEKIKVDINNIDIKNNISHRIASLSKEFAFLQKIVDMFDDVDSCLFEIKEFLDLAIKENDKDLLFEIEENINSIEDKLYIFETECIFSGDLDINNCYMDIQSGSGGVDAQDWASMLLRMYLRWMHFKKFNTTLVEESVGDVAGIKSATIKVIGLYAYGWLRTETGIHRLVRKSPFDSSKRRHTSFTSIFVYPEINDSIEVNINPVDLRIDVYRSSGAGGQHVNKTESAVRVTHLPTKIVAQCQSNRSQHKNKEQAIKQLRAKIYEYELRRKMLNKQMLENNKLNIAWGNQIRSYVLDSSRIKDLRTGIESHDIRAVLDGDLDIFIEASLEANI